MLRIFEKQIIAEELMTRDQVFCRIHVGLLILLQFGQNDHQDLIWHEPPHPPERGVVWTLTSFF